MDLLELEGAPVIDVVADVLLVGQHLPDGAVRPAGIQVGAHPHAVEPTGDVRDDLVP